MRLNVYFRGLFYRTKRVGLDSAKTTLMANGSFRDNVIFASVKTNESEKGDRKIIPLVHQKTDNITFEDIHKRLITTQRMVDFGFITLIGGNGGLAITATTMGIYGGGNLILDFLPCWVCSSVSVSSIGICTIAASSIYKKFIQTKYNKIKWEYPGYNIPIKISEKNIRELQSGGQYFDKFTNFYYPWYEWQRLVGKNNENLDAIATMDHDTEIIHINKSHDPDSDLDLMDNLHKSYNILTTSLTIDDQSMIVK